MNINYILKVEDAKLTDIQKALTAAGIKVRSIQEVYKEGGPVPSGLGKKEEATAAVKEG